LTAEPLIFDSSKQQITSRHILATTGYPSYYFWVEVEKGIYAWDGSLLSNTPLREVIIPEFNPSELACMTFSFLKTTIVINRNSLKRYGIM
jgi:predicted acylesterase/phospholipase RssA